MKVCFIRVPGEERKVVKKKKKENVYHVTILIKHEGVRRLSLANQVLSGISG